MTDLRGVGMKFDTGKLRWSLLTRGLASALRQVLQVLEYGARKYSPNSWQTVPDAKKRYEDALERHLFAWRTGEVIDPETGLPHLAHATCNLLFLLHLYGGEHEENQNRVALNPAEYHKRPKPVGDSELITYH